MTRLRTSTLDGRSSLGLSLLGLSLVTGLVGKQWQHLLTSGAFFFCYSLAGLLTIADRLWEYFPTRQQPSSKEENHAVNNDKLLSRNRRIRGQVVLTAGLICFVIPKLPEATPEVIGLQLTTQTLPMPVQAVFYFAVGCLAFDIWFSAACCQPTPKPLSSIVQDSLALIGLFTTARILAWKKSSRDVHKRALILQTYFKNRIMPKVQPTKEEKTDTNNGIWIIHGKRYCMTEFIQHHPGGREAIMLGCGRDCTALFESYHPFTDRSRQILEKYRVGSETVAKEEDVFYQVLCRRVSKVLREQGIDLNQDRAATWQRVFYYCLVVLSVGASGVAHAKGNVLGSFLLAVFGWLLGGLGHDAGHFTVSRNPRTNDVGLWGMSFLCNPIMWQHQHTFAHHSHTNSFDGDPDMHHFRDILRIHRRFKQDDAFKYQSNWLFVGFMYGMTCFGTCFWIPLELIHEGTMYGVVEWSDRGRPLRAFGLWLHLLFYMGFIMIWPFFVHSHWYTAYAAMTIHITTSSLIFAIFSQINHLNEASLERQDRHMDNPILKNSWAVSQVETSNNFCPQSVVWYFLSNGLNFQIEHHLFPGLNHCHLPRIQPVVQQTCEEYGVCYKSYNTWRELMGATLSWLDKLSAEPDYDVE